MSHQFDPTQPGDYSLGIKPGAVWVIPNGPEITTRWPTTMPIEALQAGDAYIEDHAQTCDAIFPGFGDVLRHVWAAIRPAPSCDCPMDPHHRWNCPLTPIWAQTMRDLDCNPWTVVRPHDLAMHPPKEAP